MTQDQTFSSTERDAVYRAIVERRDMRHFAGGGVDPSVLRRLLEAANCAPSVGLMVPWRFVRVVDPAVRERVADLVAVERDLTAAELGDREAEFLRLKVEGVRDCAELLVVSVTGDRAGHVFGRRTMPHMDLASVACAIQNLWLAARAENLGMGWVSLFDPRELADLLDLSPGDEPIAIVCLGPVDRFYERPMLVEQRWAEPRALDELVEER
ncbi:5,6-dimethylbenzimidazole synthase [Aeromicrobium alkaliterrae]|uniref:5,6-dimethylbenzimidazole synthase n=1 Tax=Aeromicrobium alkaliterrae TaxID=302168 RepID=A0ABN2JKM7_9ACTN